MNSIIPGKPRRRVGAAKATGAIQMKLIRERMAAPGSNSSC
jgi:hypothetical protein